jgi:hypothetical protein
LSARNRSATGCPQRTTGRSSGRTRIRPPLIFSTNLKPPTAQIADAKYLRALAQYEAVTRWLFDRFGARKTKFDEREVIAALTSSPIDVDESQMRRHASPERIKAEVAEYLRITTAPSMEAAETHVHGALKIVGHRNQIREAYHQLRGDKVKRGRPGKKPA